MSSVIIGDVNSGIAQAIAQVTNEKKVLHIVSGGHTDAITGKDCKWNVFRVCNTTRMEANAVSDRLVQKFGKKWYFITPDYAFGQTLQAGLRQESEKAGRHRHRRHARRSAPPISPPTLSRPGPPSRTCCSTWAGAAQINCMKQIVQFGMDKEMALGGAQLELESVAACRRRRASASGCSNGTGSSRTCPPWKSSSPTSASEAMARCRRRAHWFGYRRHARFALAANEAKTLDGVKLAQALGDLELPPEVKLQPNKVYYREGDHQLMTSAFVGGAHAKPAGDPEDLFRVEMSSPGDNTARPVSETGCTDANAEPDADCMDAARDRPAMRRRFAERLSRCRGMMQLLLFNITNGLIIGAFYVLMALGLSLILNLSNVINFAHGGFLVIGGYIAFTLTPYVGFWGALLVSPLLTAHDRAGGRTRADPARLWARSALQPAADLRPRLHHRGRHAATSGGAGLPVTVPAVLCAAAEHRVVLPHRLSRVHGRRGDRRGGACCSSSCATRGSACAFAPARSISRRCRRSASTSRLLRSLNFAVGIFLAGLAGVLAGGQIGLEPNMGDDLLMPSFIAIIVGGVGSLTGTLLGGLLIGVACGADHGLLPAGQRGGDLRHHGARAAGPAARACSARKEC